MKLTFIICSMITSFLNDSCPFSSSRDPSPSPSQKTLPW
jgi:hypothetical protein